MGWWINKSRVVVMPNGERWAVPVLIIIEDRAKYMFKEHPDEFPTLGIVGIRNIGNAIKKNLECCAVFAITPPFRWSWPKFLSISGNKC